MTAIRSDQPGPAAARRDGRPGDAPLDLGAICPYLLAVGGRWRAASPARAHRCTALTQPIPVPADKQLALCLVAEHNACPRFISAMASRPAALPVVDPEVWRFRQTTPVLLEAPRIRLDRVPPMRARAVGQLLLGLLMILAFCAIVLARTSAPGG